MLDYYYTSSSDEDQKEWDEEYNMHKHVARKLINGCNEWGLRKDLEKQVKLHEWYWTVSRYNRTSCSINFGIQNQEEQKNKFNHKYIIKQQQQQQQ